MFPQIGEKMKNVVKQYDFYVNFDKMLSRVKGCVAFERIVS